MAGEAHGMKPQVRCPNCGKVLEAPEAPTSAVLTRRAMLTPEGRFLGEYDAARQVVILRVVKSCDIIGVERRNRRGDVSPPLFFVIRR